MKGERESEKVRAIEQERVMKNESKKEGREQKRVRKRVRKNKKELCLFR